MGSRPERAFYTHDSIHNRLSKNNTSLFIDPLNKISSDGTQSFRYDKNGNLISDGQLTYRYDALDRLIEANGTHYVYDSFNRGIKKNDTYYLHQNLREIGSLQNGKIKEFRVLGLGKGAELGASIAIELDNNVYCPIHDFRGNIVTLIDTKTQKPAETYRYTAFGECDVVNHHPLPHNPWRFASKRYDPETGFSYFLRRYYNPTHGREISPDPIGFADGPNIYAYVHNNPMTMLDLYGLKGFLGYMMIFPLPTESLNDSEENRDNLHETLEAMFNQLKDNWQNGFTQQDYENLVNGIRDSLYSMGMPINSIAKTEAPKLVNRIRNYVQNVFYNKSTVQEVTAKAKLISRELSEVGKAVSPEKQIILAPKGSTTFNHSHPFEKTFPKNPEKLLPELPRNSKGHILPCEGIRIRPEKHPLKPGEVYHERHHGQHYHIEMLKNPGGSWNKPHQVEKVLPSGYKRGDGTGFLPGEKFPGVK